MDQIATPRLQTSLPETGPQYAPISGFAVGSVIASGLFVVLTLILAYFAYDSSRYFSEPWLFLFPIMAIALAFVARRHIRNSEGTRTGESLANRSWWVALICGLILLVVFGMIEYIVRNEVQNDFNKWTFSILQADPTNPENTDVAAAFYRFIPPGQRGQVSSPNDPASMRVIGGPKYTQFVHSKFLAITYRNKNNCSIEYNGLHSWEQTSGRIDSIVKATLITPEADYPLAIIMQGVKPTKGSARAWQLMNPEGAHIMEGDGKPIVPRTEYGWWVELLQFTALNSADVVLKLPGPELKKLPIQYALLPGAAQETAEELRIAWESRNAKMTNFSRTPLFDITPTQITVRVSIDIQVRGQADFAKARLVLVLDDPTILKEIQAAKDAAGPNGRTTSMPEALGSRTIPWKVLRIESALRPEKAPAPQQQ